MDKQIIIDGIDVSGCPHYIHKDGSCSSQDCECIKCVHNACFYKDYKNKEQECNRYKQTLSEIQQDLEFATYCESQECGCDDANECLECTKKQIIQKISECEVKNEN